jgi:hypothetical protein
MKCTIFIYITLQWNVHLKKTWEVEALLFSITVEHTKRNTLAGTWVPWSQ